MTALEQRLAKALRSIQRLLDGAENWSPEDVLANALGVAPIIEDALAADQGSDVKCEAIMQALEANLARRKYFLLANATPKQFCQWHNRCCDTRETMDAVVGSIALEQIRAESLEQP